MSIITTKGVQYILLMDKRNADTLGRFPIVKNNAVIMIL